MQGIENEGRDLGNEHTGLLADTPYPHSSGNQRVPLQDRLVRQTGSDGLTISSWTGRQQWMQSDGCMSRHQ